MVDKYLFLLFFIAANGPGKLATELELSYVQTVREYTSEEGLSEPSSENVSLVMTKQGEGSWFLKDLNRDRNSILEITESEVITKDKNPIRKEFDWVVLNDFQWKETDTIFYRETNLPLYEIRTRKEQKTVEINVLDENRAQTMNHILINY